MGVWCWVVSLASTLCLKLSHPILHSYLQFYWVLLCLACLLISLIIFVLDIYNVLIYLQLYFGLALLCVLTHFFDNLCTLTWLYYLGANFTKVTKWSKSGQIKSKSNKPTKFFLDFADETKPYPRSSLRASKWRRCRDTWSM